MVVAAAYCGGVFRPVPACLCCGKRGGRWVSRLGATGAGNGANRDGNDTRCAPHFFPAGPARIPHAKRRRRGGRRRHPRGGGRAHKWKLLGRRSRRRTAEPSRGRSNRSMDLAQALIDLKKKNNKSIDRVDAGVDSGVEGRSSIHPNPANNRARSACLLFGLSVPTTLRTHGFTSGRSSTRIDPGRAQPTPALPSYSLPTPMPSSIYLR